MLILADHRSRAGAICLQGADPDLGPDYQSSLARDTLAVLPAAGRQKDWPPSDGWRA